MALLKVESEKLNLDDLRRGILDHIVTSDEVFELMPFITVDGKSYIYNRENTLGTAGFFDVNEDLTEDAADFTKLTQELKRLIGQVDVDEFLQTQHSTQQDQTAQQLATKSKVVGRTFADKMINGNVAITPKEFDGLRVISKSLPTTQLIDANPAVPTVGASLGFGMLDNLIDECKVGLNKAFIMNSRTLRAYIELQRLLGGTQPETVAIGGAVFMTYRGFPILKNDYMPLDEDYQGDSNDKDIAIWVALTVYAEGDKVKVITGTAAQKTELIMEATTAGTSGAAEPAWDYDPEDTTVDATVTWTTRDATLASVFLAALDENEGFTGLVGRNNAGLEIIEVGVRENRDAIRWRIRWYTAVIVLSALSVARVRGVIN